MNKEFTKRLLSSIILIPILFVVIYFGSYLFNIFLTICLIITIYEWHMMSKKKSYNIFGHLFLLFSFYTIYFVRNELEDKSLFIFLFIILICISTDIGGYLFGKIFKGPKLTKISPKKTYTGVIGSFLLSIVVIYGLNLFNSYFKSNLEIFDINYLIFILIISSVSQIGDIIVSYFKRLSKIKDTGNLIPGHGGILDRIDGMIFAYPFFFILYLLFNF